MPIASLCYTFMIFSDWFHIRQNLPFTFRNGSDQHSLGFKPPINHDSWYFLQVDVIKCPHLPSGTQTWQGKISIWFDDFPVQVSIQVDFPLGPPFIGDAWILLFPSPPFRSMVFPYFSPLIVEIHRKIWENHQTNFPEFPLENYYCFMGKSTNLKWAMFKFANC